MGCVAVRNYPNLFPNPVKYPEATFVVVLGEGAEW